MGKVQITVVPCSFFLLILFNVCLVLVLLLLLLFFQSRNRNEFRLLAQGCK